MLITAVGILGQMFMLLLQIIAMSSCFCVERTVSGQQLFHVMCQCSVLWGFWCFFLRGEVSLFLVGCFCGLFFFYGVFVFVIFTAIFLCKDCSLKWQFSVT